MELVRGLQGLKPEHRGAAITVGSYDGIHLGHGALIASTCGLANKLGKPADQAAFRAAAAGRPRGASQSWHGEARTGSAGTAHGLPRALAGAGALRPALRVRAALRGEAAAVERRAVCRTADDAIRGVGG